VLDSIAPMRLAAVVIVLAVLFATASQAQDQGQIERGLALAETKCSPCHATGPVGKSVNPNAPPFRAIMQLYRVEEMEQALEEAIAEALQTPHSNPPFELSQTEIDDLIAYLKSLEN
jgi:cytochrome c